MPDMKGHQWPLDYQSQTLPYQIFARSLSSGITQTHTGNPPVCLGRPASPFKPLPRGAALLCQRRLQQSQGILADVS